ncbi:carbohydrate ABC transporter permease [Clostridium sp. MB05]|jgi:multiple sugar transport system permease protein
MNTKISLLRRIILYMVLCVIGMVLVTPFIYMISISLSTPETTTKMAFTLIPKEFNWQNYFDVLTNERILKYLLNSIILVVFCVIGQVFASSFVAYGFARIRARGKNILFIILLATMMIPSQITMIPQFIIFSKLGWINTLLPIIIPNLFGGAFNIFLIRQFITGIPVAYDEAAQLEGLGYFGIYRKIMLPLLRPILVTVAIFTFNYNWGAFMEPLIYINDIEKMPLALGVQVMSATYNAGATPEWNIVMVASLLLTIPMVAVYFLGQKYIYQTNIVGNSSLK